MAFVENISFDKRLQLGAETFARTLSFGTNWQRIRIGIRLSVNDALADISYSTMIIGVMQGTFGWNDPQCPEALGLNVGQSGYDGGTLTRIRDASGNMCYRAGGVCSVFKQNNSLYLGSGNSASVGYWPLTHTGLLGGAFVTVTKGTTYNLAASCTAPAGITRAAFLAAMENDVTNPTGWVSLASSNYTYTTGINGFDSAFIFWKHSCPTISIADFYVVRFS